MPCYNEDLLPKNAKSDIEEAIEKSKKSKAGSIPNHWGRVKYVNGISYEDIKPVSQLTKLCLWKFEAVKSKKSGKYAWFSGKFGNLNIV